MGIYRRIFSGALFVLPMGAVAAPLTVGTPSNENCYPFGCPGGDHYQQVYASGNFSGAQSITGLQFSSSYDSIQNGTFILSLSTTSSPVDSLSSTFANNIGSDNALKFTGALSPNFLSGLLTFTFVTPFIYDPNAGNLLLDITSVGQSSGTLTFFAAMSGNAGGLFSRMHNYGTGFAGYGLVTTFLTSPAAVPEPATWAMMIVGFGVVGASLRRKQKVTMRYTT